MFRPLHLARFGASAAIHRVGHKQAVPLIPFGNKFSQPITGFVWPPASLLQLSFGWNFNQPCHRSSVAGVLHQLSFRRNFNQPVGGVERLASIQHLSLGS